LGAALRDHEQAIQKAQSAHANEMSAMRAAQAQAMQQVELEAKERLDVSERAKVEALAAAAAAAALGLEQLRGEHAEEKNRLDEQAKLALAAREGELIAQHGAKLRERDDRHTQELTDLGRKLEDAEAKGAQLAARLSETEQAKAELEAQLRGEIRNLEGHLGARTEERDLMQAELSSVRNQLSKSEQMAAGQAERISALEATLVQTEQRVALLGSKISTDNELLERVRRALGIGVGLLEQQKQNMVESA
jgi:chromosome segregation ATPase